jgi:hypothetical protein
MLDATASSTANVNNFSFAIIKVLSLSFEFGFPGQDF